MKDYKNNPTARKLFAIFLCMMVALAVVTIRTVFFNGFKMDIISAFIYIFSWRIIWVRVVGDGSDNKDEQKDNKTDTQPQPQNDVQGNVASNDTNVPAPEEVIQENIPPIVKDNIIDAVHLNGGQTHTPVTASSFEDNPTIEIHSNNGAMESNTTTSKQTNASFSKWECSSTNDIPKPIPICDTPSTIAASSIKVSEKSEKEQIQMPTAVTKESNHKIELVTPDNQFNKVLSAILLFWIITGGIRLTVELISNLRAGTYIDGIVIFLFGVVNMVSFILIYKHKLAGVITFFSMMILEIIVNYMIGAIHMETIWFSALARIALLSLVLLIRENGKSAWTVLFEEYKKGHSNKQ